MNSEQERQTVALLIITQHFWIFVLISLLCHFGVFASCTFVSFDASDKVHMLTDAPGTQN
jgi:hypothetical protein